MSFVIDFYAPTRAHASNMLSLKYKPSGLNEQNDPRIELPAPVYETLRRAAADLEEVDKNDHRLIHVKASGPDAGAGDYDLGSATIEVTSVPVEGSA